MNIVTKLLKFIRTVSGHGSQKKDKFIPITFQYDDKETTIAGTKLDFDLLIGNNIKIHGTNYKVTSTIYNLNENKYIAKCMKWE